MIRLLRIVSWRTYAGTPGRLALMIGGIAAGVALIAALGIINASVLSNFRTMLERTAGKAALQIELGTGEIGFGQEAVEIAAADPAVKHAFGMVRGTLHAADDSGEVLHLFGVDLVSDAVDSYDVRLIDGASDPLELLNEPRAILIGREYADRAGLAVGSVLRLAAPSGIVELRVRGLLEASGLATVFGGNLAIMDLPAAQELLGKNGRVDQVDLVLDPSAAVPDVQARLSAALPASLSVSRPAWRGERFEKAVAAFQAMLDGLSLLCLLAGIFIVYNTASTAIAQRARDLATILTLGAARRQIFSLVVIEATVIGIVASLFGIMLGLMLAHLLTSLVAQSMGVIYQIRFPVDYLGLSQREAVSCVAMGTGSAVAASIAPAWKASRIDPIELMRPDYRDRMTVESPNRLLLGIWLLLVLAAAGAAYTEELQRSVLWSNVAATLWWLSGLTLAIPAMEWMGRWLNRLLPRFLGIEGKVAAAGLRRAPGRTGVTTAVIALSLTLAVTVASVARSFRESERNWFILAGDLVVSAVGTEGGWLESPLRGEVHDLLRQISGVDRVETYRVVQGQEFRSSRIALVAVSAGFVETDQFRRAVISGDVDGAIAAVANDRAVLMSDNLAERFMVSVGDDITMASPSGMVSMKVEGIVTADYSGDQGSVIMHKDRLASLWNDTHVSHFNLFLEAGADIDRVRARVVRALRNRYVAKVLTVPQTLAYHQSMVDRAFAFTYAIQLLVIVVTLAGITDLLTTQVIERRREMGILRMVGASEHVVARAIWLEALVVGISGAALGAAISIGTSLLWVKINFRILIGYILEHHFAFWTAGWCFVLAGAVAFFAGWLAATRALREPILESLRHE